MAEAVVRVSIDEDGLDILASVGRRIDRLERAIQYLALAALHAPEDRVEIDEILAGTR